MRGISADILGQIILQSYKYFPELYTSNYTLGQVLTAVRFNSTSLALIVNSTGLDEQVVTQTVDFYLTIMPYFQSTVSTPAQNQILNISDNVTICQPDISPGVFTSFTMLPALLIILVLSCLSHRKRSLSCFGWEITRPGLCIPVNLVDSYENRFAFACAFGATTTKCLSILFYGGYNEIFSAEAVQLIESPLQPSWMGTIWKIIAMFAIGLAYYPLFACMATNYKITGLVIGFVYSASWVVTTTATYIQCPETTTFIFPMDIFVLELPVILCLAYLTLRYFVLLVKAVHRRCRPRRDETEEEDDWRTSYTYKYVLKLLEPIPKEMKGDKTRLREKLKGKLYKWKPEFKYSTRVICTYFISFIGVYEVLGLFTVLGGFTLKLSTLLDDNTLGSLLDATEVKHWLFIAAVSMFVAVGLAAIYSIALVTNMLSWYRKHLFCLRRGEKEFLPVEILSRKPSSITVATLKYCGYQVAYLVWGVTIFILLLSVVGFVVGQQLIVPMLDGRFDSFLWNRIKNIWPAILISLAFFAIQFLLSKFVFLVDRGNTLALNNRRLFHVCTFFLFFFNIFLGVVSCLKRIIIGAALGVMFLGRTQKSVIPRDYELMDPGFNAYLGYLFLEHAHANPILVTFCQLLMKSVSTKQCNGPGADSKNTNHYMHFDSEDQSGESCIALNRIRQKNSRRVRNRWQLYISLYNNPSLQEQRHSEMFSVKSPFAAFEIMIEKTVMQQITQDQSSTDGGALDIKL